MGEGHEHGTRERILLIAEKFFGDQGYHGTRLHHIAEQVGIQKASLFHYFPSKAELYRAVIERGFGETEETISRVLDGTGEPMEKLRRLVDAYIDMVASNNERTKIFLRLSLGESPADYQPMADAQHILSRVVRFVTNGQESHELRLTDPLAIVLAIVGMVAFFFTSAPELGPAWADDPFGPTSIERVKRQVGEVIERCLALRPGEKDAAAHLALA